jgi:hypothetical protein
MFLKQKTGKSRITKALSDILKFYIIAANKRRIVQNDDSSEEDGEEDELNSSDNDSESENEMGSSKRKTATRKRARKAPTNVILNTSSQLLEQVSQATSTQDTLYGNCKN